MWTQFQWGIPTLEFIASLKSKSILLVRDRMTRIRNNYRAIAVGRNLGNLFSNILLSRLLELRVVDCPKSHNQRGFCKGAQTSDHIFTLNTEKYVIYSCFVDFQKAFTTVSREHYCTNSISLVCRGSFWTVANTCTETQKQG